MYSTKATKLPPSMTRLAYCKAVRRQKSLWLQSRTQKIARNHTRKTASNQDLKKTSNQDETIESADRPKPFVQSVLSSHSRETVGRIRWAHPTRCRWMGVPRTPLGINRDRPDYPPPQLDRERNHPPTWIQEYYKPGTRLCSDGRWHHIIAWHLGQR